MSDPEEVSLPVPATATGGAIALVLVMLAGSALMLRRATGASGRN